MITLFSYPELYGMEDNNPYGLKVFAFLKLCGLPFEHQHILDTRSAPRGQLPFISDGETLIGDSDAIVSHLKRAYKLDIDDGLTEAQHDIDLLVRRALDDLYWVMSYSRWADPRFWPTFRDALLAQHADITTADLEAAQSYNFERYRYQGIGRYAPEDAYARGLADLRAIANLLGDDGFVFGARPTSIDAAVYGFVASIHFYDIETPLKQYVEARPGLVRHCLAVREEMKKRAAPGSP